MKNFLTKIFISNWQRKTLAFILSIILWIIVNQSLFITKTIKDVPIKVINISKNKTIRKIQSDGLLDQTISIPIYGNKKIIDKITRNDIEVFVDLKKNSEEEGDEIESEEKNISVIIDKPNLISKNPKINIDRAIKKIIPQKINLYLSNFVHDQIPLVIAQPAGESPNMYQYLDTWPKAFYITVSGPEESIAELKTKGVELTFNLNDITENELNIIEKKINNSANDNEVVSYFIPTSWKRVYIPEISAAPIEIDDPSAALLRIDFMKKTYIPFDSHIPVFLFFSDNTSNQYNPKNLKLAKNDYVKNINGIDVITRKLYINGVSEIFMKSLQNRIYIIILIEDDKILNWNIQIVLPLIQQNIFINKILTKKEKSNNLIIEIPKEYLKQRFRAYSKNLAHLWISPDKPLNLKPHIKDNQIYLFSEENDD